MNIIEEARNYVTSLMEKKTPETLVYHTINHTRDVVQSAEFLGKKAKLNDNEFKVLILAAWFHDIGYINKYKGHEEESKKIAKEFLEKREVENIIVEQVLNCIDSTRTPQSPGNNVEKVLCDADLFHLSTEDFTELSLLFMKELILCCMKDKKLDEYQYWEKTIDFFDSHTYFTDYGKEVLAAGKEKNRKLMEKRSKRKPKSTRRKSLS